ncbi:MAG: DsbA family protein [Acidimicrobiia bacterium]|nr:DsbA family protein [Acidimicrobiia bacterium]
MVTTAFAVTWDYRCPFARNASEHILTALEAGADWDVTWVPFSLNQVHVEEGEPDVWDDPSKADGLLAMQAGIAVRDHQPDVFFKAQRALFAARHDEGRDIREEDVVRDVLEANGADADAVFKEIAGGQVLKVFRTEHERAVGDHQVFGVPTFIKDRQAVFVRVMDRPGGDADRARTTIDRVLDLLTTWPELNEFKHTSISR